MDSNNANQKVNKARNFFNTNNDENSSLEDSDSDLDEEQKEIFFSNNNKNNNNRETQSKSINSNLNLNESEQQTNLNASSKNQNSNNKNNNNNINNVEIDIFDSVYEPGSQKGGNIIKHDQFYKQFILDPGNEGRKASRVLFLRSFNNWVKATMINKYTLKLYDRTGEHLSILDLCCGRGGDLEKYFRSKVRIYVGSDLAEESLKNAIDRYEKLKNEKFKDLKCKCYFICEDLSSNKNNLMLRIPQEIKFDFVSCQFALHYHFESEARLRTFLTNVVQRLNPGGFFVGTIIDSNVLVKKLRESKKDKRSIYKDEKFTFGNQFYAVKFSQKRFPVDKPFGIRYGFFLEDSIDKRDENGKFSFVGEYLIIFDKLVEICKEFDLHLVDKKNFHEFYEENSQNKFYKNMLQKMLKDVDNPSAKDQWDIIYLYMMFAFQKGLPTNRRYEPVLKTNIIVIKDWEPVLITDKFE